MGYFKRFSLKWVHTVRLDIASFEVGDALSPSKATSHCNMIQLNVIWSIANMIPSKYCLFFHTTGYFFFFISHRYFIPIRHTIWQNQNSVSWLSHKKMLKPFDVKFFQLGFMTLSCRASHCFAPSVKACKHKHYSIFLHCITSRHSLLLWKVLNLCGIVSFAIKQV